MAGVLGILAMAMHHLNSYSGYCWFLIQIWQKLIVSDISLKRSLILRVYHTIYSIIDHAVPAILICNFRPIEVYSHCQLMFVFRNRNVSLRFQDSWWHGSPWLTGVSITNSSSHCTSTLKTFFIISLGKRDCTGLSHWDNSWIKRSWELEPQTCNSQALWRVVI